MNQEILLNKGNTPILEWDDCPEGLCQRKNVIILNSSESLWQGDDSDAELPSVEDSVSSSLDSEAESVDPISESFLAFRLQYLIVHIAIMLADGMQGTHLYALYESYGYSVASLYSFGFVGGALSSPFIGPIVDRIGRKKSAIIYCVLEMIINHLEQYDIIAGLIFSRVVGGITTNLLFSVFEAWLVTEHRKRGFSEEKLEVVMRDSTITSNMSAIMSGCIAHALATAFGAVGPFKGAVVSTLVALLLVTLRWEENYGSNDKEQLKSVACYMREAFFTITSDSKILRIGVIQGLTDGTLQTFIFLWSPALSYFSSNITPDGSALPFATWGLDRHGEPAYGLIFGAFMLCGVIGGITAPALRKYILSFQKTRKVPDCVIKKEVRPSDGSEKEKPAGVEFLAALSYLVCSLLLLTPILVNHSSNYAFSIALASFLLYEVIIGLYLPFEGVIRTIYMPNDSICSIMTMLRVIINVIVAAGVFSTNYISFTSAFAAGSFSLFIAFVLQLTLIETLSWAGINNFASCVVISGSMDKKEK